MLVALPDRRWTEGEGHSRQLCHDRQGEEDWWGSNGGRRWRGGRGPQHSVNFVTAHDGFTLADLVSYNRKHNEANGEGNRCARCLRCPRARLGCMTMLGSAEAPSCGGKCWRDG